MGTGWAVVCANVGEANATPVNASAARKDAPKEWASAAHASAP
jgi:hypothetical protein